MSKNAHAYHRPSGRAEAHMAEARAQYAATVVLIERLLPLDSPERFMALHRLKESSFWLNEGIVLADIQNPPT